MRVLAAVLAAALFVVAWAGDIGYGQVDSAVVRLETGLRFVALGWAREGQEHLQQAVRLAPGWTEARVLLALSHHAQGQWEQALAQYEAVLERDPDLGALRVLMGDIYFAQGRLDEAAQEYSAALAHADGAGWAYYGLGRVQQVKGEDGAVDMYAAAVSHAPDLLDARIRLGRLLRASGRLEEALEHLQYAQRLNSRLPEVRLELGIVYELLGRIAEAEHEYRMVIQLDPANDEALLRLGTLEAAHGDT